MSQKSNAESADDIGFGTVFSSVVGAGVWMFISSNPSPIAWIIAALILIYLILGYCLLEIYLMEAATGGSPVPVHAQNVAPLRLEV